MNQSHALAATLRRYGPPPFRVAVLHGGPGAPGELAPVARKLSVRQGVLEPLQNADSVSGQVEELAGCLRGSGEAPLAVVGFSWGAWLGLLLAARHPELVGKLILVSSGPLTPDQAAVVLSTRLGRLEPDAAGEARALLAAGSGLDDAGLARLGALLSRADAFDPLPASPGDAVACRADIFAKVWPEAAALRQSGALLQEAARLRCPVLAIHGDFDPHPVAGVREPLGRVVADFTCVVLSRCGHTPWRERQAREPFYQALFAALPR